LNRGKNNLKSELSEVIFADFEEVCVLKCGSKVIEC